ncbi:aminoglycoside phosphotransferase family protein [Shewanella maritima]|uniref:Aminoglycoside phosphotransferase family protein n=1 Tax=Shewanella maritima TaxID=2520507 RepID=A0A411PJ39_9GAMM|nr:aminoglycoside phosphotransferase family protein [Shewanella maritima]QBF83442.1 aminoglycoside phosphotransferase family protein [Shewanella maritima]
MEFIRKHVLPMYDLADASVSPLGNGHINRTYLVKSDQRTIVLQHINTQVFPQPELLVKNALSIAAHLTKKQANNEYQLAIIKPVLTVDGQAYLDFNQQGFWRAITFLPGSHTIEVVKDQQDAQTAAKAFGHFAAALSDLDPSLIDEVIVNFLNLGNRIDQLKQAIENDAAGRLAQCQPWADFVLSQQGFVEHVAQLEAQLPLRICHNDTKINNMLFNKQDMSSLAVIDLDTCMPGYLMYDFGDMVRAFCSPEAEDSTNLASVIARPEVITAAANSYIEQLDGVMTALEKQSLWVGLKAMALMLGCRFLTDHLNGDVYFAVHRPQHNLDRAANQLTIYQSLLAQESQLQALFS